MHADRQTEVAVDATIKKLTDAYKRRNLEKLMECFAPDADLVLYGTGADEKRIGPEHVRAQVERDWAQTESIEISFAWKSISAAGTVAWVAADGSFKARAAGQDMGFPVRASFVLEKRGGEWLVVHSHFSTPASGQGEGRSV